MTANDDDQPMMNDSRAQFKLVKCRIAHPPSHFDHHHFIDWCPSMISPCVLGAQKGAKNVARTFARAFLTFTSGEKKGTYATRIY